MVFGLSGGLDSAVVATLCKRAIGSEKILALMMPEKDSKKEHMKDAISFVHSIGIQTKCIDLTPILKELGTYQIFRLNKMSFLGKVARGSILKWAYHFLSSKNRRNSIFIKH